MSAGVSWCVRGVSAGTRWVGASRIPFALQSGGHEHMDEANVLAARFLLFIIYIYIYIYIVLASGKTYPVEPWCYTTNNLSEFRFKSN